MSLPIESIKLEEGSDSHWNLNQKPKKRKKHAMRKIVAQNRTLCIGAAIGCVVGLLILGPFVVIGNYSDLLPTMNNDDALWSVQQQSQMAPPPPLPMPRPRHPSQSTLPPCTDSASKMFSAIRFSYRLTEWYIGTNWLSIDFLDDDDVGPLVVDDIDQLQDLICTYGGMHTLSAQVRIADAWQEMATFFPDRDDCVDDWSEVCDYLRIPTRKI